jgi:hypothetical protein
MKKVIFLIIIGSIILGCKEEKRQVVVVAGDEISNGTFIGDSIIYDMVIKNVNPDDEWAEECLKNLDRERLIQIIFDAVYEEVLIPYDYYENKPLKISDIKKLEADKEFSRNIIGKLQFEEEWSFDENTLQFRKKVNSILLAYEVYNSVGEIRGYKPAFYVRLN